MRVRARGRFLKLFVVSLFVAVSAVLVGLPPGQPPAAAFKLGPHEHLVRTALAPFAIPSDRMNLIVGNIFAGSGNLGSDQYQFTEFRHFDNAPDRATVCQRANDAWTYFYAFIRINVRPANPPEWNEIDNARAIEALSAFGALTHSLQDFYSHSNWLEAHVLRGQSPGTADALFPPPCNSSTWPGDLQTGYFNLKNGIDGCPGTTPPAGFGFCHEALNKDNDASKEGGKQVPGMSTITYHQLAMQLATAHTANLYQQVVDALKGDLAQQYPQARPDCVVAHLFQGSQTPCRFGRLSVVNDDSSVTLGHGTIQLVSPAGQVLSSHQVQSWPPAAIQTSQCLSGLTVRYDVAVLDKYAPSTPRRIQGQVPLTASGCDATGHLSPRSQMRYLVRFVNQDTKLPAYTNVIAVVNGVPGAATGPVPAGAVAWMDLGLCLNVANFDFTIQFIDPGGTPRTATPDPPPFPALTSCVDSVTFDLGGQLYP